MSRDALIEAEAKRRCLAGGYPLDMAAGRLTSFSQDCGTPLWTAFVPMVEAEIETVEDCGFEVLPAVRMTAGAGAWFAFFAGAALAVLVIHGV